MFETDLEAEIQADCLSGEQQYHAAGAAEGMKTRLHFTARGMSSAVSVQNIKFSSGQSARWPVCFSFPVTPPHTLRWLFCACDFKCLRILGGAVSGKVCVHPHHTATCIDNVLCQQKCIQHLQSQAQCWHWRCQQEEERTLSPGS